MKNTKPKLQHYQNRTKVLRVPLPTRRLALHSIRIGIGTMGWRLCVEWKHKGIDTKQVVPEQWHSGQHDVQGVGHQSYLLSWYVGRRRGKGLKERGEERREEEGEGEGKEEGKRGGEERKVLSESRYLQELCYLQLSRLLFLCKFIHWFWLPNSTYFINNQLFNLLF